jgi:CRP-like cAMP-binding protein
MDRRDESPGFGDEVLANSFDHLRRSRLFAEVPENLVETSAALFAPRLVPDGTALVLDGRAERTVHVLRRGRVRLELRGPGSAVLVVRQLAAGDAFGVETLVERRPQFKIAVCTQRTMLLSASAAALQAALGRCARFSTNVAAILALELEGFATAFHGIGSVEHARRVYAALERISLERGVQVTGGTLLDIELGVADLAALTRSSPQEVAAAVFFLERDGWIRTNGSLITLVRR